MGEEMVQIQFKIPRSEYDSAKKYIGDDQERHWFGRNAFREKINRMEGRDKDSIRERMAADGAYLQKLIDGGFLKVGK